MATRSVQDFSLQDRSNLRRTTPPIIWRAFQYYPRLKKLHAYVSEHPAEALSLRRAASIAAMTRNYFAQYFRQNTGVTFKYWTDYMRVERAVTLLQSSDMSVMEVAQCCGFFDSTTFTRTFRRIKGVTPKDFRRGARPEPERSIVTIAENS